MIVASVVVLALALTAVSGITYSWFSDSETAKVDVTTGHVNIETVPEKMVLSSLGSGETSVPWEGETITGQFPFSPGLDHSASIAKSESGYAIDIKGILSGDEVKFTIDVTNKSSVPAYITCTSNEDKALFDVTITCSESLLDVPVDNARTFKISIKLASGVSLTASETSTFNIEFTGYQGNYASTIHEGTATITGNKIVSGDVAGEDPAKDVGIKVDFSEVTKVNGSINILGSTIAVKSKLTGGISNEFGTIELTLTKDGAPISSPTFDGYVEVTAVFNNVVSDPGEIIVKCNDEVISATNEYDAVAKTFTVKFSTTHFSDFTILPIVAKIGSDEYTSVKAAFDAAYNENHIEMVNDSNETDQIVSTKTGIVLDLGDCNIVFENDGIRVGGGSLTINGEKGSITGGSDGTPDKEDLPVYAMGGTLTINGGKFVSDSCAECIYAGVGAKIIINGGTFESTKPDMKGNGWLINVNNGGSVDSIVISGGSFKGYNPRTGDDSLGKTFLKSDYTVKYANGYYEVIEGTEATASVDTVEDLTTVLTTFTSAGSGNTDVTINSDISLETGDSWTPISVDGYNGAGIITIDGNGYTISGLDAPLFAGGFAGKSGIVIRDLTLSGVIINEPTNTQGLGAFIGSVDSMQNITLTNCHLINSEITSTGEARVGGLIGWTSGYDNPTDGPVDTHVTVENCSVENVNITAKGSVGAIIGHAGNNPATYQTIKECTIKNCKLTSTDGGNWRVGVVVGTANVGQLTISSITESGNTITQTEKTAPAGQSDLYGRFVPGTTGKLTIDGEEITVTT